MRYFFCQRGRMGTRASKGNNKPGKKLYKAKATLGSQNIMEIRHEDKTVQ